MIDAGRKDEQVVLYQEPRRGGGGSVSYRHTRIQSPSHFIPQLSHATGVEVGRLDARQKKGERENVPQAVAPGAMTDSALRNISLWKLEDHRQALHSWTWCTEQVA